MTDERERLVRAFEDAMEDCFQWSDDWEIPYQEYSIKRTIARDALLDALSRADLAAAREREAFEAGKNCGVYESYFDHDYLKGPDAKTVDAAYEAWRKERGHA